MPVDHERKLLFIHIPKTGGTTISTLIGLRTKNRSASLHTLFGDFGAIALEHLTLAQAEQFLTADEFGSYFRFAFVRNPWDRAVSGALWQAGRGEGVRDLGDFIDWSEGVNSNGPRRRWDVHALPQSTFLTGADGRIAVPCIGRFENYAHDVERILSRFVKIPPRLPRELEQRERRHYRDYYRGNLAERVAKLYAQDVQSFGYTF